MRAVQRLRFRPEVTADARPTLIDRYLDRGDNVRRGRWTAAPEDSRLADIVVSLIDTTGPSGPVATRDDAATIWHVLWVRGEDGSVQIGSETWPIAPGDTIVVPPGRSLRTGGGQLAVAIALPGRDAPLAPPTHGEERYFGHNRRTVCCRVGDVRLCRWKLTQPLALAEHHPDSALVLALARDSVIRTATTIDRLAQGELAVIDPAASSIVTPDGLSYLLTIDRDRAGV
jgi:hypothetical protein